MYVQIIQLCNFPKAYHVQNNNTQDVGAESITLASRSKWKNIILLVFQFWRYNYYAHLASEGNFHTFNLAAWQLSMSRFLVG